MITVDLSQPVTLLDGSTIPNEDGEPATYDAVAITALLNAEADKASEKLARFSLAQRIQKSPEKVDLDVDDASTLKTVLGNNAATLVYGRFCELLGDI